MSLSCFSVLRSYLQEGSCHAVIEVQHKNGVLIPFTPYDLYLSDEALLLSLEQERSRIGEALVDSLWFDRLVYLWIRSADTAFRFTLRLHRIHIVGRQFSHMLCRARKKDPIADIDADWELQMEDCEKTVTPLPTPLPCSLTGERDCHLDHLLLYSCNFDNK